MKELCPLCKLPANEGEHQIWLDPPHNNNLGCRVPMWVYNAKRLGVISS